MLVSWGVCTKVERLRLQSKGYVDALVELLEGELSGGKALFGGFRTVWIDEEERTEVMQRLEEIEDVGVEVCGSSR